jgi:hypothetical protein
MRRLLIVGCMPTDRSTLPIAILMHIFQISSPSAI